MVEDVWKVGNDRLMKDDIGNKRAFASARLKRRSKPTRADYSATTGSQTARHNATHLLDTKRPKNILHSKKISVAFQSRG